MQDFFHSILSSYIKCFGNASYSPWKEFRFVMNSIVCILSKTISKQFCILWLRIAIADCELGLGFSYLKISPYLLLRVDDDRFYTSKENYYLVSVFFLLLHISFAWEFIWTIFLWILTKISYFFCFISSHKYFDDTAVRRRANLLKLDYVDV